MSDSEPMLDASTAPTTDAAATAPTAAAAAEAVVDDAARTNTASPNGVAPTTPDAATDVLVCGIDMGTQKSVVAAARLVPGCSPSPFVVNNNLSNQATPSIIAFRDANDRLVGEEAASVLVMRPNQCVHALRPLLGLQGAEAEQCGAADLFVPVKADPATPARVSLTLADRQWSPEQLAATCLCRLASFASAAARQRDEQRRPAPAVSGVVLTTPTGADGFSIAAARSVRAAAAIADLPVLDVVTDIEAAAVQLSLTACGRVAADAVLRVLIVDVGHGFSQAGVVEYTPTSMRVIAQRGTRAASAHRLDVCLAERVLSPAWAAKHGGEQLHSLNAKSRARLLKQAEKTKQVLSTINTTTAAVAHLDDELSVPVSRAAMEEAAETELSAIEALVRGVLDDARTAITTSAAAGGDDGAAAAAGAGGGDAAGETAPVVSSVEVIGGGIRVPAVQARVLAATGGAVAALSFHLDGASAVADGAAVLATTLSTPPFGAVTTKFEFGPRAASDTATATATYTDEELAAARALEQKMVAQDRENEEKKEAANSLESMCYALREDVRAVPEADRAALNARLDAALAWHGDNGDNGDVSLAQLRDYTTALVSELRAASPALATLLDNREAERKKAALAAAEAEQRAKEEAKRAPARERPLTNVERIAKANKLKAQATDLWKNADMTMAATRWIDALGALEGAYDLSPQHEEEMKTLRMALYANLSMAYLKLEVPNKALHNCQRVLELDDKNVKALYRRGQARQMLKQWDEAAADFKQVLALEAGNRDAAAQLKRTQAVIAQREEREKKMYSAMFG